MLHLTHTGYYAGLPYCGIARGIEGEEYAHPNVKFLEKQENREKVCPECLKIWDNVAEVPGQVPQSMRLEVQGALAAILPTVPDGFRFTLEGMEMNNLPSFRSYGNYKSDNYGAHALVFSLESKRVYFSYQTPVAFWTPATGLVCRVNDWGPTTGKHLNAIQPDKSKRVQGSVFERMLQENIGQPSGCAAE